METKWYRKKILKTQFEPVQSLADNQVVGSAPHEIHPDVLKLIILEDIGKKERSHWIIRHCEFIKDCFQKEKTEIIPSNRKDICRKEENQKLKLANAEHPSIESNF